jgi:phenylacetic acid degradation operon negative regulatory protein
MQPKTEEFLNILLWTLDLAMRPTFRNLDQGYEAWAYRNGFLRQVDKLAGSGLLERRGGTGSDARVYRLTERGRLQALGGRDPAREWCRRWDGRWRMVLFDIGEEHSARRNKLRRYLRARGFGYLQHSVWISPHPLEPETGALQGAAVDVESLILLEARPAAGESDSEIVSGAWDFTEINKRYASVLKVLQSRPCEPLDGLPAAQRLKDWARRERAGWLHAVAIDPLLPRSLWPRGYLGERVWKQRLKEFRQAGRHLAGFRDESE